MSDSESDEGLELPSFSLKQDVSAAEKQVDELYKKAAALRDALKVPLQDRDGDADCADSIQEKLAEIREKLSEKRPSAWRAAAGASNTAAAPCSPVASDAGDADGRSSTPVIRANTITDLELELAGLNSKRKTREAVARNQAAADKAGACSQKSHLEKNLEMIVEMKEEEIDLLRFKVDELSAKLQKLEEAAKGGSKAAHQDPTQTSQADVSKLKDQLSARDIEIEIMSQKLAESHESVAKKFKTELQALRIENEDLRNEREGLDRQVIELRLDKEEAESALRDQEQEREKFAHEVREEVKRTERARIQAAALQLQKENQKKTSEIEKKLKADAADEREKLEERIHDLEMEITNLQHQISSGHSPSRILEADNTPMHEKLRELQSINHKEKAERRRLQLKLLDYTGAVRVYCRVRPTLDSETGEGAAVITAFSEENTISVTSDGVGTSFELHSVFRPTSDQQAVFNELKASVSLVFDGYQQSFVTFGAAGTGKSHTVHGTADDGGLLPRALDTFVVESREREKKAWQFEHDATAVEVFKDGVSDLLAADSGRKPFDAGAVTQRTVPVEELRGVHEAALAKCSGGGHFVFTVSVRGTNEQLSFRFSGKLCVVDASGGAMADVSQAFASRRPAGPSGSDLPLCKVLRDVLAPGSAASLLCCVSPCKKDAAATVDALAAAAEVGKVEFGKPKKNLTRYRAD